MVMRGVYARTTDVKRLASWARGPAAIRVAAAAAVVGPGAAGSWRDAAGLHGIELLGRPQPGPVSVTRPAGLPGSRTARPGVRLHIADLPRDHCALVLGAPVTSAARTVVDLARTSSFRGGVVAADSALRLGLTTKPELRSVLAACARWPGIARARQAVDFSDHRSESPFESIARVAFQIGGLPPPELQAWVGAGGEVVGRVDFFWPAFSTIAEADGALKYSDPQRARLQLDRDARLRAAGFEVVHFGWRELELSPDQVIQAIKAAFERASVIRSGRPGVG